MCVLSQLSVRHTVISFAVILTKSDCSPPLRPPIFLPLTAITRMVVKLLELELIKNVVKYEKCWLPFPAATRQVYKHHCLL